jgi:hypothetical protein
MKRPAAPDGCSDELVTSQWLDRVTPNSADIPERRLLVAVLLDAIRCLQIGGQRDRAAVIAWIQSAYGPARLSFGMICDGLGFETRALARRLLAPPTSSLPASDIRR